MEIWKVDVNDTKAKIKAETDYWLGLMAAHGVEPDRITRLGEKMEELLQLI